MQFQNRQRFSWAFVFGLVLWTFTTDGASASTFEAGVDGGCANQPVLGPSPASGSFSNSSCGSGSGNASGIAEGGTLRALAVASSFGPQGNCSNLMITCFRVVTVIDDIIISGPGPTVVTSVSADLTGVITSETTPGGDPVTTMGNTTARLQVLNLGQSAVEVVTAATVDTTLTTAVFSAPVNQAIAVRLTLRGGAGARATRAPDLSPGTASSSNDFGGTLNFAEGIPVFDLPAGYTANSVDGEIVDNVFVGKQPAVPALGGPSVAVLASLLVALGVRRLATGAG